MNYIDSFNKFMNYLGSSNNLIEVRHTSNGPLKSCVSYISDIYIKNFDNGHTKALKRFEKHTVNADKNIVWNQMEEDILFWLFCNRDNIVKYGI